MRHRIEKRSVIDHRATWCPSKMLFVAAFCALFAGCASTPQTNPSIRMNPRITVLTIGVDNLERSLNFYRDGLGFQTEGIVGTQFERGAVVFFHIQPGIILALYPRTSLAYDATVPVGPHSESEFSIGHNVGSKQEVDAVMEQARHAGAVIAKPACATFWGGYAGYFEDPDGHLWEVLWNPNLPIKD